jgi:tRNA(fMet)-specific endonuclease VapC
MRSVDKRTQTASEPSRGSSMTMNKALLDTDILSEVLKRRDANVVAKASAYMLEHRQLTLSSISVLEVIRGYRRVGRDAKVQSFEQALTSCDVLSFDEAAGRLAGRIYADLETRGRPIGMPDVMIASIALQNDIVLATANVAHFAYIRDTGYALKIENWRVT